MGILREEKNSAIGIYVHIPFCISKCPYCDFRSVVNRSVPEKEYIACLLKELSFIIKKEGVKRSPLESIYIGGGTPSLFSPPSISFLIKALKMEFPPLDGCEVTIEINPDTIDRSKLKGFKKAGVNRVSLGVQSLNGWELKILGRTHSAEKAIEAFYDAREEGFENIGVDLIFGVPGQKPEDWRDTLLRVIDLRPEHISLYGLTLEEGTPFWRTYENGKAALQELPHEEEELEMYETAISLLSEGGFRHYEISNFALPGFLSVHNRRYWLGKDYIGLGASAHSYLSYPGWGRRWWNDPVPSRYMEMIDSHGDATAGYETLKRDEAIEESLLLGIRMIEEGLNGTGFRKRFGSYPKEIFKNWVKLEKDGYLYSRGEDLLLTHKGIFIADEILPVAGS